MYGYPIYNYPTYSNNDTNNSNWGWAILIIIFIFFFLFIGNNNCGHCGK